MSQLAGAPDGSRSEAKPSRLRVRATPHFSPQGEQLQHYRSHWGDWCHCQTPRCSRCLVLRMGRTRGRRRGGGVPALRLGTTTHTARHRDGCLLPLTWKTFWFSLFCSSRVQTWFCSNREFPSNAFWGRKHSEKDQKRQKNTQKEEKTQAWGGLRGMGKARRAAGSFNPQFVPLSLLLERQQEFRETWRCMSWSGGMRQGSHAKWQQHEPTVRFGRPMPIRGSPGRTLI